MSGQLRHYRGRTSSKLITRTPANKPLRRQGSIYNAWARERGLRHLEVQLPVHPRLTDVFNKQIEIGQIIREGLRVVYSPARGADQWPEVALNEVNARLARFKDSLPAEMRLKEWSAMSEPIQPQLAALQCVFPAHTRIMHFR
jgi:hypothetical protein